MDVFGTRWADHAQRIHDSWERIVGADDVVLIAGDISWALRLDKALPDLEFLAALPGRKVLIRGNHDYWWASLAKLTKLSLPGMHYIHNSHLVLDGIAIGGTRLWDWPDVRWPLTGGQTEGQTRQLPPAREQEDPEKIRAHELERLALSLGGMPADARLRVCMTHFPPIGADGQPTELTRRICGYGIDLCVYGHIHNYAADARPGEDTILDGTRFVCTATDRLDHAPLLLAEL